MVNSIVDISSVHNRHDRRVRIFRTADHHVSTTSTVSFGAILNALINFLLVGVAVYFCVILPINKLRDLTAAQDEADAEEQGPSVEEQTLATLQEIRDELKKANNSAE